jgi:hypothetical protein
MISAPDLRPRRLHPLAPAVDRVSTVEDLLTYEETWHEVESADSNSTVFGAWEWARAAALRLLDPGARLWTLVVSDDDEPIGIAPLVEGKPFGLRTLAFFASGTGAALLGAYQDLLAVDGRAANVVDAIAGYLNACRGDWDMLWLRDLPPASPMPSLLAAAARDRGWIAEGTRGRPVHSLELPETWDAYRLGLPPATRDAIDHNLTELMHDKAAVFRRVETRAGLIPALKTLFELDTSDPQGGRGSMPALASGRARAFHAELAEDLFRAGMLDLALLEVDGRAVGARYSFSHKGRHYFFAVAREASGSWANYDVPLVMNALALRAAIEAGFQREEFLSAGPRTALFGGSSGWTRDLRIFHNHRHRARFRLLSTLRRATNTAQM